MPVPRISRVRSDRGIDTKASSAVSTAPPRLDLRSKAGHALKFTQLARFLLFSNTNTKKHLHIFAGLGSCSFVVRMLWAHFCWRRNPCSDRAQSDLDLPHMYRQLPTQPCPCAVEQQLPPASQASPCPVAAHITRQTGPEMKRREPQSRQNPSFGFVLERHNSKRTQIRSHVRTCTGRCEDCWHRVLSGTRLSARQKLQSQTRALSAPVSERCAEAGGVSSFKRGDRGDSGGRKATSWWSTRDKTLICTPPAAVRGRSEGSEGARGSERGERGRRAMKQGSKGAREPGRESTKDRQTQTETESCITRDSRARREESERAPAGWVGGVASVVGLCALPAEREKRASDFTLSGPGVCVRVPVCCARFRS
eukprot:860236-Rhodomonas_salina.1